MRHSIGATKRYMLVRHETGFPGRPNTGTPFTSAKIVGFPGFSCRPSKWIRPARAEDFEGEVAFADRAAAGEQHQVLAAGRRRTPGSAPRDRRRVRGATTGSPPCAARLPPRAPSCSRRRSARPQPSARRDDLVAGRKNRDARPDEDIDRGQAERGRDGEPGGREHRSFGERNLAGDEVAAGAADVLPWLNRLEDPDAIAIARSCARR